MNPSYNAGGSSIPGAKPGVIASGPDSSSQQPSMPVAPTPAPMSLGGARKSGGSKKWLLVGAGVLIVALIVVLVVFAVMPKNGGGNGSITMSDSFNTLINYITSGTKTDNVVTEEYDIANNYYFLNGWNNEEEKATIYTETKTLMDRFVNGYTDGENEMLNNLVKSTKEQFNFVYAMDLSEKIYQMAATTMIIKEGDSKAKQDLLNHYELPDSNSNVYTTEFLKVYNEWIDALISQVNLYQNNGCVMNDYIDSECMKNKNIEVPGDANELYMNVLSYYNMASGFVGNVYNINDLLQGKTLVKESDE